MVDLAVQKLFDSVQAQMEELAIYSGCESRVGRPEVDGWKVWHSKTEALLQNLHPYEARSGLEEKVEILVGVAASAMMWAAELQESIDRKGLREK
jgi:hypothetical protein